MQLYELVKPLFKYRIHGDGNPDVRMIQADSRKVEAGGLFAAVPGYTVDGHDFAAQAVEQGAVALIVERPLDNLLVPQIVVDNARYTAAILADVLYRHPSRSLSTIGVTGTNGKTTVTHMIRHLLELADKKTGLIGTVGATIGDEHIALANTTPEAVDVHRYLRKMRDEGCSHAVMEVSSHALVERRVAGVAFRIGVFTNLTQDHLDFHGTMDAYAQAKALLFARLGNTYGDTSADTAYAVVNADDGYARMMQEATVAECVTYGLSPIATVRATDVELSHSGAKMTIHSPKGVFDVQTKLIGRFNVYNTLAAFSVALLEEVPVEAVIEAFKTYQGVPGRCERVDIGQDFGVFVDYAHTPDGLDNVLSSVRELTTHGRVITVVGCGGDRDKAKRPLMAASALKWSDVALFTSDNPRTEEPEAILDDMEAGVSIDAGDATDGRYRRVVDRRAAIHEAIALAGPGDIVVIAGKGHEDYQIIGRTKTHFDDREEARRAIASRLHEKA